MAGGGQAAVSFLTRIAKVAAGLGLAASVASTSLYTVDGGERAVIFDRLRGVLPRTEAEGTHLLVPILQKPFIFDIRTRPHSFSSTSGTKDLQMVSLTLRVLSRPDVDRLPEIFNSLGLEYDEKVLPSIGNEVLKAVVAQFNADQLLTERPHVSALVRESLTQRAREFNIVLDDVAITHLAYGPEFAQAVEKKQVAQQEAERSRFLVARADQERRAAIVRAEGESEAARLISEATTTAGNGLIELRRIEAAKEIAGVLARSPNISYIPGGDNGQMLLGLNAARLSKLGSSEIRTSFWVGRYFQSSPADLDQLVLKLSVNGRQYNTGYYLADGIYPEWAAFVKSINSPQLEKHKAYARQQEAKRKDVERAFGVLQTRFNIVRRPARSWKSIKIVKKIMTACVILHNMIVEDEGEMVKEPIDLNAVPGASIVLPPEVQNSTKSNPSLDDVRRRNFAIRSHSAHSQLKNDLIEHIWQRYGTSENN